MNTGPRPVEHRPAIWLIEDNAMYRDTLAELLRRSGRYRCTGIFAEAETALRALRDGRELPRLVLMDLALPGMSGIEAARRVRQRSEGILVVMLTVHQSNDQIFQAICAGASGYLLKSASREEIVQGIGSVLDGGGAMDAQIARRVLEMFARMATPQADYRLSEREREILQHLVDGLTKHEIADVLGLSVHTVDTHVRNIYGKLHVDNRTGAVAKALRENLL